MKRLDNKWKVIIKSESRMKPLVLPIPILSGVFIKLFPAKSIEEEN